MSNEHSLVVCQVWNPSPIVHEIHEKSFTTDRFSHQNVDGHNRWNPSYRMGSSRTQFVQTKTGNNTNWLLSNFNYIMSNCRSDGWEMSTSWYTFKFNRPCHNTRKTNSNITTIQIRTQVCDSHSEPTIPSFKKNHNPITNQFYQYNVTSSNNQKTLKPFPLSSRHSLKQTT